MQVIHYLFSILLALALLTSCSNKKKKSTKEAFTSFISSEKNIVSFGQLNFNPLINEIDYSKIPKLNLLIAKEIARFSSGIDLNNPIYFANKGLFIKNGIPEEFYLFAKVKNKDSLTDKLNAIGIYMEKKEDYNFTQNKNYAIGITNELIVFHYTFNPKKNINLYQIIHPFENKTYDKKINSLIQSNSPFSIILNLSEIYKSTHSNYAELIPERQKELNNSFLKGEINFNKGAISFKIKNEISEKLKERLFFIENKTPKFESFYGQNHIIGLSYNINPSKLESLLLDYIPNYTEYIAPNNFAVQLALFSLGNQPISSVFGNHGTILYSKGKEKEEIQTYIELGNQKESVIQLLPPFLKGFKELNLLFTKNTIQNYTSTQYSNFETPRILNDFGKEGINGFIDFSLLPLNQIKQNEYQFVHVLKSLTIKANNNEVLITIQGLANNKSLPNQILELYIKTISNEIQNISF